MRGTYFRHKKGARTVGVTRPGGSEQDFGEVIGWFWRLIAPGGQAGANVDRPQTPMYHGGQVCGRRRAGRGGFTVRTSSQGAPGVDKLTVVRSGAEEVMSPMSVATPTMHLEADTVETEMAAIDDELKRLELELYVRPAAVVEPAERIVSLAGAIGYDFGVQRAQLVISDVDSRQGEFERALSFQRTCAAEAEVADDRALVSRANLYLASTYFRVGMTAECQAAAAAAVELLDDGVVSTWRAEHLMVFALFTSYHRVGEVDFDPFETALREARLQNEPILLLAVLNNFAWLAYEVPEQRQRAYELAGEMEELIDRGVDGVSAALLDTLAVMRTAEGQLAKAEAYIERALVAPDRVEPDTQAALMTHLADVRREQGRPYGARELLEQGRASAMRTNTPEYAIEALRRLAEIDAELGDYRRAYRRLRRFLTEQESFERHEAERQAAVLQKVYATRSERKLRRYYEKMAAHDALTGLYNRRYFDEHLGPMLATGPLSVAFVDIDGFKSVNDENSHLIGDAVLRGVSELLANMVGMLDPRAFAARLGGDELVAVIPHDGEADLVSAFEELRLQVADRHFDGTPPRLRVTVSVGVAAANPSTETYSSLLARVDEALYCAKRGGRNQMVVAA